MNDIRVLRAGALAGTSLAIVRASVSRPIVDHSILFARLLADDEGCLEDADYDEDPLFAATVMHDPGLGDRANGEARFEVEGADLALPSSGRRALANATLTGFGRRSPCTRRSASRTGAA